MTTFYPFLPKSCHLSFFPQNLPAYCHAACSHRPLSLAIENLYYFILDWDLPFCSSGLPFALNPVQNSNLRPLAMDSSAPAPAHPFHSKIPRNPPRYRQHSHRLHPLPIPMAPIPNPQWAGLGGILPPRTPCCTPYIYAIGGANPPMQPIIPQHVESPLAHPPVPLAATRLARSTPILAKQPTPQHPMPTPPQHPKTRCVYPHSLPYSCLVRHHPSPLPNTHAHAYSHAASSPFTTPPQCRPLSSMYNNQSIILCKSIFL